jgi:hypothetical protein
MVATLHPLAEAYLDSLERAARRLPRRDRGELVAEIRAHLLETVDPDMSDAEVLTILDRLGDPEEIVEAQEPDALREDSRGTHEWAAIFLLLLGGFVFGVGWIVGLILLWSSRAWTTGQKLIGTFVVPGGLAAGFVVFGGGVVTLAQVCTSTNPGGVTHCSGGAGSGGDIVFFVFLAVCVFGPICTAVYLARAARIGPRAVS